MHLGLSTILLLFCFKVQHSTFQSQLASPQNYCGVKGHRGNLKICCFSACKHSGVLKLSQLGTTACMTLQCSMCKGHIHYRITQSLIQKQLKNTVSGGWERFSAHVEHSYLSQVFLACIHCIAASNTTRTKEPCTSPPSHVPTELTQ